MASGAIQSADIPDGKTCRDCFHFVHCHFLIRVTGSEVACDWVPSRFLQSAARIAARKAKEVGS